MKCGDNLEIPLQFRGPFDSDDDYLVNGLITAWKMDSAHISSHDNYTCLCTVYVVHNNTYYTCAHVLFKHFRSLNLIKRMLQ